MDDDFNTAAALAAVHDLVREVNIALAGDGISTAERDAVLDAVAKFDSVLGIFGADEDRSLDAEIKALVDVGGPVIGSPVVSDDGIVYIQTVDGTVSAFTLAQ